MYVLTTSNPVNTAIYKASFVLYDGTANFSNILILSMNTLSTLPFPPYNTTYLYHYSYTFFSAGSFPPPSLLFTGDEFSSISFLAIFKFLYLMPYITNATTQALISYIELVLIKLTYIRKWYLSLGCSYSCANKRHEATCHGIEYVTHFN